MKRIAWAAGTVIAVCIVLLTVDWAVAFSRALKDDKIVKQYQKEVKENPAVAPKLEAEQKRITSARIARRKRDRAAAWILIAAAALFLASVKHRLPGRTFVALSTLKTPSESRTRSNKKRKAPTSAPASFDVSFVDELVARHGRGKEAAIPLLQAIQSHYRYLPDEALRRVCELTEITPAEISGTSTFYGQFRRSPVGKHVVRVCHGTACHVAGARQISDELRRHLKIAEGADTDVDRMFTVEEVACLGCCSLAPVLMVDEHTAGRLTPASASSAIDDVEQKEPA